MNRTEPNRTTNREGRPSPRSIPSPLKFIAAFLFPAVLPALSARAACRVGLILPAQKKIFVFLSNVSILYYLCKSYESNGAPF